MIPDSGGELLLMNENNEKIENGSETSARAERIKAIRAALRDKENSEAPVAEKEAPPEEYAPKNKRSAGSGDGSRKPRRPENPGKSGKKPVKKGGKKKRKKKKKTFGQRVRGLFPEKGDSVWEVIRKIIFLASVIAIVVCGYMVSDYYLDLWRNRKANDEIVEIYNTYLPINHQDIAETTNEDGSSDRYYELMDGAKKLLDMNEDTVGFLTIPTADGTPIIALPVVQANDNEKYLDRSFKGEQSRAGALFMDWRNSFDRVRNHKLVELNSENIIIYGHNMADESMFGKLKYYERNYDYYEKHPIIQMNSNYDTYTYKIFSVMIVDALDSSDTKYDCWNRLNFSDENDFYDFVNGAKRRSMCLNDVDVLYGDQLLTLSTCNYLLDDRSRLIIMARQVRPGEDPYEGTKDSTRSENVLWPSMYYDLNPKEKYDWDKIFVPYGPEDARKEAQEALEKAEKEQSKEK